MDSVDAREHIATGRWFSSPPVEQAETKRGRPRKQNDGDILAESDSLSEK